MSELRSISNFVPGIAKDIFGKKSSLFGKIISEWYSVAGREMAAKATPIEIIYSKNSQYKNTAILHIAASSSDSMEIEYQKSLLKERINTFLGYPAISDIKIIHMKATLKAKKKKNLSIKRLSAEDEEKLEKELDKIVEKDLKIALKNLGKAITLRNQ